VSGVPRLAARLAARLAPTQAVMLTPTAQGTWKLEVRHRHRPWQQRPHLRTVQLALEGA
jgi:hypothetical protein